MAIKPIQGFYVHDEDTGQDGTALYDYRALENAPNDLLRVTASSVFGSPLIDENYSGSHTGSSAERIWVPFRFQKGKEYKISVTFVEFVSGTSGEKFSVQTNSNKTASNKVDILHRELVTGGSRTDYSGKKYEYIFTATNDASWLYIYMDINGTYNFSVDVEIYEEIDETVKADRLEMVANCYYAAMPSPTQRLWCPYEIVAGEPLAVRVDIPYFKSSENANYIITLSTTLDETYSTIQDSRFFEITKDFSSATVVTDYSKTFEFIPTKNANYFYLYIVVNTGDTLTNSVRLFVGKPNTYYANRYELGLTEKEYSYDGKKIVLARSGFDVQKYMTLSKDGISTGYQGIAVCGNNLYQLFHGGYCNVYDLSAKNSTPVAKFQLGSFDAENNHANSCNFSGNFYNGNTIPLLYVTDGNSAEVMKCSVENITENNGTYSASTVQTIALDQSGFESAGFVPYWGWSTWFADGENDLLYYFGAKYRTNGSEAEHYDENRYIVTTFRLPDVSESDIVLTASDVLDQFTTVYDVNVTQGGTLFDRKIFYTFGFGEAAYPSAIRVFDIAEKSLANRIDLSFITEELEACAVWNGALLVVTQSGNLYRLTF